MINAERLRSLLYRATKRPWKQTYAYNNAGMPTADFYIPGHNGNATVEILADDAALIVEGVGMLPDLLKVFEAAVEFKNNHVSDAGEMSDFDRQIQVGKLFGARDKLLLAVEEALREEETEEDSEA
jgi:hypothetical protein